MSTYRITAHYLEHTSGTKFYETLQIDEQGGASAMMKRHGPLTAKIGGGQIIPLYGNASTCSKESDKILNEKRRVRSGGKYEDVAFPSSLAIGAHAGRTVDGSQLVGLINEHYPPKHAEAILKYFGLHHAGTQDEESSIVSEDGHASEPDRADDANWGAW